MSTRLGSFVYQWSNFVQFRLLPPTCVLCQRQGQTRLDLCRSCEASLPWLEHACPVCALPLPLSGLAKCGRCLQGQRRIHRTFSAFRYDTPVSGLISQFKYQRRLAAGRVLTSLLAQQIQLHYQNQCLPELLLPIPLHPARLRQRGYNQALLMTRELGQALQIPLAAGLIHRTRATPAQQGLKARERRRNLRGAFAVDPKRQLSKVQRVALIDDVVTTMSTVQEVARALQQSCRHPLEIHVWCLARA